jgi:hypothetical protein
MAIFSRFAFVFPLVLLSAAAGAVEPGAEAGAAPTPTVAVGDSWTYQYTDVWKHTPGNLNRTEVTAVDASGIQVDVKRAASGAVLSHYRYTLEMNPIDRGRMHFAPHYARYAFPLVPGKTWTTDATGDNPDAGKKWRYQVNGKVIGWEKISVPAGEFDVIKVEVVSYYQGQEVGSRGGSGQSKETVWYAPAVNNFVKLEYQDTNWQGTIFNRDQWELTTFVRHK